MEITMIFLERFFIWKFRLFKYVIIIFKGLSALDVLHEAGLINLFGKFPDVDQMVVSPILLSKGSNKIAIYGIGSQRDDRIARAFQSIFSVHLIAKALLSFRGLSEIYSSG
jgi:hypothetical protein